MAHGAIDAGGVSEGVSGEGKVGVVEVQGGPAVDAGEELPL